MLTVCPRCGAHARPNTRCPSCTTPVSRSTGSVAAALLSLTLLGCPEPEPAPRADPPPAEPIVEEQTAPATPAPIPVRVEPVDEPKPPGRAVRPPEFDVPQPLYGIVE